jgi:hypothetical protein
VDHSWHVKSGQEQIVAILYQTKNFGEAHLRVALVDRGSADLLVHRVSSRGLARGEACWHLTNDKQDARIWVYICSAGMAHFTISFVDSYGEAGWQVERPRGVHLR